MTFSWRRLAHGGPCTVVLVLVACAGRRAQPPSTDFEENDFRDTVGVLASDSFEGRRPGTAGEDKTLAFLVDNFRKLGLKPGNGSSFLQPVPLTELTPLPDMHLSITDAKGTRILTPRTDMVIWSRRVLPQSSLKHSELVFAGYGIVAPKYHWNDYAKLDVHGKTVVVLDSDPGFGNSATSYGRWSYKVEEAARQGAAGVLLIYDQSASGKPWDTLVGETAVPRFEPRSLEADPARAVAVEGWITRAVGRTLFFQAGLDFEVLAAAAAQSNFTAVSLNLKVDAEVHSAVRQIDSANVVAVLPGGSRKREYVIYTAHWDHLGRVPGEAQGGILPGAVDNASGIAGLLMLARSLSRTRPTADRSFAFIAFTAEEYGLLGSAYYVDHPLVPLADTVGALNLDILHIGGPTRDVVVFGYGNSELDDYVRDAALLQGRKLSPDPSPKLGRYFNSDQFSFARKGVPALYAQAGLDDSARGPDWGRTQLADYMLHRYHQPTDTYSAQWDIRGTLEDLKLYYDVGNRLAHARRFPRFYAESEFRSGRAELGD